MLAVERSRGGGGVAAAEFLARELFADLVAGRVDAAGDIIS